MKEWQEGLAEGNEVHYPKVRGSNPLPAKKLIKTLQLELEPAFL